MKRTVVLAAALSVVATAAGAQTRPDRDPQERVSQAAPEQVTLDIARIRRLLARFSDKRNRVSSNSRLGKTENCTGRRI